MAWYNKYRPQNFEEVVGQQLVKTVLINSLKLNKIKHGYLFSGSKGTGKTTLARIFARQLNDTNNNPESNLDIIEMDAASNTGVDDIRQLIESAAVPPIAGKYKIYIVDEVHMLSKNAMNALLKTLEEPPQYVIFLLATTNAEKLLPTVLSRLTKLNLQNHTIKDLINRLQQIAAIESIIIDDQALELIAKRSSGGQRDAINILETLSSYELTSYNLQNVAQILGILPVEILEQCANFLQNGSLTKDLWDRLESLPIDGETFLGQLLDLLLDRSLTGQHDYDSIIIPVVEIIGLRLPLTSPLATMAILQAKINNGQTTKIIESSNPTPIQKVAIQVTPKSPAEILSKTTTFSDSSLENQKLSEPKNTSAVTILTTDNPSSETQNSDTLVTKSAAGLPNLETELFFQSEQNEAQDLNSNIFEHQTAASIEILTAQDIKTKTQPQNQIIANTSQTTKIKSSLVAPDQIQKFIRSLTSSRNTPALVKIILSDLTVDSLNGRELSLSVSNGIFSSQLASPKIKTWLTEALSGEFGDSWNIVAAQRSGKKTEDHQPTSQTPGQVNSTSEEQMVPVAKSNQNQDTFYSIYKELPPNSEGANIPIQPAPIPAPEIPVNWDDVMDGFELEE